MKNTMLLIFMLFSFSALNAQSNCEPLLEDAEKRLYDDISYLASDDLQGRRPGEEGIELARRYIAERFELIGLEPMEEASTGYEQVFTIPSKVTFGEENKLVYEEAEYALAKDYFPAQWTANGSVEGHTVYVKYGITAPELEHDDYAGLKPRKLKDKIFVMDISSPDGVHPHSKYLKYHNLGDRLALAREKGAKGVILVNLEGKASDMEPDYKKVHSRQLPVIFITDNELAASVKNKEKVSFTTHVKENRILAYNLVGMINNNAPTTVIIGAHYDHLGLGGEGSLFSSKEPTIHNGADDNASGVAGMLELARNLRHNENHDIKKYNYLFAAFSGEEMGLLGSSFFVENFEQEPRFMINLDMIGRLEENQLAVNGVGTSPQWADLIREKACNDLRIKTSESGVGPSDHTNFYYKDIPVLHFFTGTHMDYHKPADDFDKINYAGEVKVLTYIYDLLHRSARLNDFPFTPTANETQQAPRFTVTLGVMPDYMFEGEGMRIDGVTEGKPAHKAGLQAGDIVVKLGEVKVVDMMSYMKALASFEKGSLTEVSYMREGKTFTVPIQF